MGKKSGRIMLLASLVTASALFAAAVQAQSINIGSASGTPGQVVPVDVTITVPASLTDGVAGTQNDITFDRVNVAVASKTVCQFDNAVTCTTNAQCSGDPADTCDVVVADCSRNTAIGKESTVFNFQPPSCTPGTNCTGIRSLVFSQTQSGANRKIADGARLYTCNVKIADAAAPGSYPLTISNVVMSFPSPPGGQVPGVTGNSGTITVTGEVPTNTPTNTPVPATNTPVPATNTPVPATNTPVPATNTPVPATNTARATATNTAGATATATGPTRTATQAGATATPTVTRTPVPAEEDDDGCQIATPGGGSAWLLLIPAVGLLVARRRR